MYEQQVSKPKEDQFLDLVTEAQGWLYAYILSLLANHDAANEVLQESNLVIWRKHEEFELGTNFRAWALRIANFQVMAFRQKRVRELQPFNIELMETIGRKMQHRSTHYDQRLDMLAKCLEDLSEYSRDLVTRRYIHGDSVSEIAQDLRKDSNAVRQIIFRIKAKLIECTQTKMRKLDYNA